MSEQTTARGPMRHLRSFSWSYVTGYRWRTRRGAEGYAAEVRAASRGWDVLVEEFNGRFRVALRNPRGVIQTKDGAA